MVKVRSRVGVGPTTRTLARTGLVLLAGLGTAACSGSPGDGPRAAPRTTTTTLSVGEQSIIQGWKAAEQAFYTAALTNDAASPALAATMVDPALQQAHQFLFAAKYDGYVGRGTFDLGHPQVVSVSDGTAAIESCVYGGVIEVLASSGQPAPAPYGVASNEEVRSTLTEVSPGLWKISRNSVTEGQCSGA